MKKLLCKALCAVMTVSVAATTVPFGSNAATKESNATAQSLQSSWLKGSNILKKDSYVEGEIIVVSAKNAGTSGKSMINVLESRTKKLGAVIEKSYSIDSENESNQYQVSLIKSEKYTTKELMEKYQNSGGVKLVQPNFKYHAADIDKTKYNNLRWGLHNEGQNAGEESFDINSDSDKVKMAAGEEKKEKVVAIIDTGVDYANPELSSYIWNNPNTNHLKGEHGFDFANMDADPMDDYGHGTHCAGIITSVLNGENVKIMPIKFLDSEGYGDSYSAIEAYQYIYTAQKMGVNVVAINNSWGGDSDENDVLLNQFINLVGEKGAVSVCAAGNDEANLEEYMSSPACMDSPYIISVAASNEKGELAQFSNYSTKYTDIAAPGTDILSYVSYHCFNPAVYKDSDDGKELCATYQDFNGELVTPDVPQKLNYSNQKEESIRYSVEKTEDSVGEQEVTLIKDDFFGEKTKDAQALQWKITGAEEGDEYLLYLPYEQEASLTPVHLNMMLKMQAPELVINPEDLFIDSSILQIEDLQMLKDGSYSKEDLKVVGAMAVYGKENYWNQISLKKDNKVKKAGKRAIVLKLVVEQPGDYSFVLDDFAISKSNVEEEEFGKTAFYNGTSMATPYVAGAVASIANAYPQDTVKERIARVEGSVQKTESLKDKTASGGVLDLEKSDQPQPVFEKILIQENGALEFQGNFFREGSKVIINGQDTAIKSQTEKSLVVEGNYYNKNLSIEVVMGDSTYSDNCYFAKGATPKKVGKLPIVNYDTTLVCAGDFMYIVSPTGEAYGFSEEASEYEGMVDVVTYGGSYDAEKIFDNARGIITLEGEPVCLDSTLYAVVIMDNTFSREAALIMLNMDTMQWEKVADLPDDYSDLNKLNGLYAYDQPTLAAYDGKLYLLGGFDEEKETATNGVYIYDVNTQKWSKGISMPEGRFASKALQTGNKLVVTLGGNGTEKCPETLVFDGKTWTVSKAKLDLFDMESYYYGLDEVKSRAYATGRIGISAEGIVYTACKADGLGDTFIYDVKSDKYIAMNCSVGEIGKNRVLSASTLGNTLYILAGSDGTSIEEELFQSILYAVNVKDGRCCVTETQSQEGGSIWGTGLYMPGSNVTIIAEPWEDYYVKNLWINGKRVDIKKEETSATISNISTDISVSAEFGAYVTDILLDNEKISLAEGKRTKLNVQTLPENAESDAVSYKSSNTKVVTVDSKGNIKAAKNAAGKSAVITVTAKDRNIVIAKCKVKVKKQVYVKKISLSTKKNTKKLKAGKSLTINATVTPAKADVKELKWISSNKKYATVSNGKVTAKKAGIGKTVTITAKATDGSKVKASVKIKIVK